MKMKQTIFPGLVILAMAAGLAGWFAAGTGESRAAGRASGEAGGAAQSGHPFPFVRPGDKSRYPFEPQHGEGLVKILYRGFLNREPGREEVSFWRGRIREGYDRTALVRDFMNADEVFVRQLYVGLLGREPDPVGLAGYTRELRSGRSREEVIDAFIYSPEFTGRLR